MHSISFKRLLLFSVLFFSISLLISSDLIHLPSAVADTLRTEQGLEFEGKYLGTKGEVIHFRTDKGINLKFKEGTVSIEIIPEESVTRDDQEIARGKTIEATDTEIGKDPPYSIEVATEDYEEIVLKSGGVVKGLIEKVTDEELEMTVFLTDSSIARATFSVNQIAAIRKLEGPKREELVASVEWLKRTGPGGETFKQVGNMKRVYSPDIGEGWEIITDHFYIVGESTDSFMKAVARRMEQMFEGYHTYFNVAVEKTPFIQIYIFPSYNKYAQWIRKKGVEPSPNVAGWYFPDANLIVTHHEYETEAAQYEILRSKIQWAQNELDKARERQRAIEDYEYDANKQFKYKLAKQQEAIRNEAEERIRALRSNPYLDPDRFNKLRDVIDAQRDKQLAELDELYERHKKEEYKADDANLEIDRYHQEVESFLAQVDEMTVSLLSDFEKNQLQVLYHEAWHAYSDNIICHNEKEKALPLWLEEGMAEFFSNSDVNVRQVFTAKLATDRLLALKLAGEDGMIPLKVLFGYTRKEGYGDEAGLFYAESWGFVYYINQKFDLRNQQLLLKYIENLGKENPSDAFQSTFGVNLEEIEQEFKAFVVSLKLNKS